MIRAMIIANTSATMCGGACPPASTRSRPILRRHRPGSDARTASSRRRMASGERTAQAEFPHGSPVECEEPGPTPTPRLPADCNDIPKH